MDWSCSSLLTSVLGRSTQIKAVLRMSFHASVFSFTDHRLLQLFIPFTFAVLGLVSHQYELDPILVFFGQSETTPFRTLRIKEPYVQKLLLGRAIWVSILVAAFVSALTLIFWAVPGHRL